MSRSYREPWYTEGYGTIHKRWSKKYANRVVRRTQDIPDGSAYRKIYDPYNICDYKWRYNPWPVVYWNKGVQKFYGPDPLYKINRK